METVWILGGQGFIGHELVQLIKNDYNVITTSQSIGLSSADLSIPTHSSPKNSKLTHFQMKYDFENFKKMLQSQKIDSIIFLSGNSYPAHSEHSPFYEIDATYLPFLSLTEAIRLHSPESKAWFASSVAVYGATQDPLLSEKSDTQPLSFYGVTKKNIEEYIKYYARVHNLKFGAFRIFSTYGPRLQRQLIYDLAQKMIKNPNEISVFGDGNEARDLSYVTDQARAMALIHEKVVPRGDIYNVGSGRLYTVNDIIKRLSRILNINPKINYIPKRSFDGAKWCADISQLRALGFQSQFDIDQGLALTVRQIQIGDHLHAN